MELKEGTVDAENSSNDMHWGSSGQTEFYSDPIPLQVNEFPTKEDIEAWATIWVYSNVIKLNQLYGTSFEGCEHIAYDLLMKIDQKRNLSMQKAENPNPDSNKRMVSKEVRNLAFDIKF